MYNTLRFINTLLAELEEQSEAASDWMKEWMPPLEDDDKVVEVEEGSEQDKALDFLRFNRLIEMPFSDLLSHAYQLGIYVNQDTTTFYGSDAVGGRRERLAMDVLNAEKQHAKEMLEGV